MRACNPGVLSYPPLLISSGRTALSSSTALSSAAAAAAPLGAHTYSRSSSEDERSRSGEGASTSASSPVALRDLILAGAHSFSARELAHAFSRLAALYRQSSAQLPRGSGSSGGGGGRSGRGGSVGLAVQARKLLHSDVVLPAVQRLAQHLPRAAPQLEPQQVAECLWAMSVLHCYDRDSFDALCMRGHQVADCLAPADCARLMLAFGRLKHYQPELIKHIPLVLMRQLQSTQASELSSVLWGFAKLGIPLAPSEAFMEAACDSLLWTMDRFGCQELVTCLWSLASLGHVPTKRLLRAVECTLLQRVHLMNPQDVANALWAFGRLRYKATDLLDELPRHIAPRLAEFSPQELSCLLYGYTQARHYHCALMDAAAPVSGGG
jgi:hypothetical protein